MGAEPQLDRELALVRTFRSAFAALADFKDKNPEAAARVADVIAAHLRSAHPAAAYNLPAAPQENPIHVANGVPFVEQPLSAKARYGIRRVDKSIELYVMDESEHDVCQRFTASQADQFASDWQKVRASR